MSLLNLRQDWRRFEQILSAATKMKMKMTKKRKKWRLLVKFARLVSWAPPL